MCMSTWMSVGWFEYSCHVPILDVVIIIYMHTCMYICACVRVYALVCISLNGWVDRSWCGKAWKFHNLYIILQHSILILIFKSVTLIHSSKLGPKKKWKFFFFLNVIRFLHVQKKWLSHGSDPNLLCKFTP